MAGRGRGRGKFTFDVSKVGFQKGEALPASIQQPPPLFPVSISFILVVFHDVIIDKKQQHCEPKYFSAS
jgi:hypothetical protein